MDVESFRQEGIAEGAGGTASPVPDLTPQLLPGAGSLLDGARVGEVDLDCDEMLGIVGDQENEESVKMLLDQEKVDGNLEDPVQESNLDHGDLCLNLQEEAMCNTQVGTVTQVGTGTQVGTVTQEDTGGMQLSQDTSTVAGSPKQQQQQQQPQQVQQQQQQPQQPQQECSGCKKSIIDRFLLKAMDQYWHEDCLKCSCCDCRLGEVGSTLFAKSNLLLCRRDYLRLFGTTGYCSACSKMIPAFEMVMRAKNNVYHLECFACQMCNHRFCVGDRFFLCDNKILCEYDYEERMVFANMTYNYNALSQIKRQTNSLSDDLSSGYGSPSPGSL